MPPTIRPICMSSFLAVLLACFAFGAPNKPAARPSPAAAAPAAAVPAAPAPKPASSAIRLIIARSSDISLDPKRKDKWFGPFAEAYCYLRLSAVDKINYAPRDSLARAIKGFGDVTALLEAEDYKTYATQHGCSYLFLQQFEAPEGKDIQYLGELFSVKNWRTVQTFERTFAPEMAPKMLDSCITIFLGNMGITPEASLARFFKTAAAEGDAKSLSALGSVLMGDRFGRTIAPADAARRYDELARGGRSLVALHAAALTYAAAGANAEAASAAERLIAAAAVPIPSMSLLAAQGYAAANKCAEALRAMSGLEKSGPLPSDLLAKKAGCLEAQKKDTEARAAYEEVLARSPNQADALLFMARQSNRENQPARALDFADRYLKQSPANTVATHEKGKALAQLGRTDEAIKELGAAAELLPDSVSIRLLLAQLYLKKNDPLHAAQQYQAASQKKTDDLDLLFTAANAYERAGKKSDARDLLRGRTTAFGQQQAFSLRLGRLECELGDSGRALPLLETYVSTGGKDPEAVRLLAGLYYSKKKFDQARPLLMQVLPAASEKNSIRMMLADIASSQKQPREAITYLQQVVAEKPTYPHVNKLLAEAHLAAGDKAAALTSYLSEKKQSGLTKELATTIAQFSLEAGGIDRALAAYADLTGIDPKNGDAWFTLARLYIKRDDLQNADAAFKRGLAVGKADADLWCLFGDAWKARSANGRAIEAYEQCAAAPGHMDALVKLADLYAQGKRDTLAAEACLKLSTADTSKARATQYVLRAARHYERAGMDKSARDAYARYLDAAKSDPEVATHLASLEFAAKNYPRVIALLGALGEPQASQTSVVRMLADACLLQNKQTDALPYLKKLAAQPGVDAPTVEQAAQIAEKGGDTASAIAMYERYMALSSAPKREEYAWRLTELYEAKAQKSQALARYRKNIEAFPRDKRNYERLAALLSASGAAADAEAVIDKAQVAFGSLAPSMQKIKADALMRKGDNAGALTYYQRYLKSNSADSTALFNAGSILYARKEYARAAELLTVASALMPRNFDCHWMLGLSYVNSREMGKAAWPLERAASIHDKDTVPLLQLAACQRALKSDDKLIETLTRLAALKPKDGVLGRELGGLLLAKGRTAEALPVLESAGRSYPNDAQLHIQLAQIYKQQNNQGLMLVHYEAANKADPRRFEPNYELGMYQAQQKQWRQALPYLQAAIAADPKNANANYQCGLALKSENNLPGALKAFQSAASLDPKNVAYLAPVIELSYQQGKKKEALFYVKKAMLAGGASDPKVQYYAGILYMESGSPDSAKAYLEKAINADRECSRCCDYLGDIAVSDNRLADAASWYQQSLDISRNNPATAAKLGSVYLKNGQTDKAEALYERLLGENPKNDEALYRLWRLYRETGHADKAQAILSRRPAMPNSGWSYLMKGQQNEEAGRTQDALVAYTSAARMLPDNADAQAACGRAYYLTGNNDNALQYLGTAIGLDPQNFAIMVDMGKVYEAQKSASSALDLYKEAINNDPTLEDAYYYTARLQSRVSHEAAIETILAGIKANPKSAKLYLALGHEYRNSSRMNDALDAYDKAIRYNSTDALEAYRYAGDIYYTNFNNKAKAKDYYQKYVAAGGKDPAAAARARE